ncbi:AraC family transcriptional regulator [Amycolatopsis suaedae]|uniref:AraC family transcriptional regulator n=2 Tax=Amycolatopsis suaedae TaxID=2510978 RepID=A0A4Q7J2Y6_9PSEU|nr:AraC family transcriptional regulator [Amycolatopsis suaedae]
MSEKFGEQLTIDDVARAAMFSKFHFTRMFQQATGVTPGRFLSALRLAEAKRLLLSTPNSVADISHQVGYNSVGTFSTRFSARVGISPTLFRQRGGVAPANQLPGNTGSRAVVRGRLTAQGPVFVGLFPGRIPEGRPVCHTVLDGPGPYVLPGVPDGSWHLHAYPHDPGAPTRQVAHEGPLTIRSGPVDRLLDIRLRPVRPFDPPVLLAPPERTTAPAAAGSAA